ncbi:type II methionyl aminopeptidase [Candidatus Bathycorpusculum sp.]|uniref:type II methionyl aminopeptidase n=1 Tax=Candidatus Bathycorpusculum sp. TaxID=2994959 RepID=UPI002829CA13|nr:type II methionyl aminopeptidase [Candidatus Termitimicrobium sp.]MCL2431508.1 type II methionyl aminopeptidase [Candidatus Termitimicrobium sp.]
MPYDKEELENFRLSGRILRETREEMRNHVKENIPIIDVCEKTEALIRNKGGKPAFPVNVSINEVAAHYTAPPGETAIIPEGSIVKVDLGVQVDGYVTDTAFTVAFSTEGRSMVAAAELALKTIIDNIHGDMMLSKIGSLAETAIKNRGFKPISNLTGHSVGRYLIHAGTSIPSVSGYNPNKIHAGEVYAVEPFVTLPDAIARVDDYPQHTIYRFLKAKSIKTDVAKKLVKYIESNFHTLPFTERWLIDAFPKETYKVAFKELLASKSIMAYPVFIEASRKPVAQAEHTLLIKEDGCEVLT